LSKSIRRYKEHLIVKFPKEADHHHLSSFSDKIRMEILKRGVKNIIFDFSDKTRKSGFPLVSALYINFPIRSADSSF
jgi:anti-anti-sigma regulatory factor